jgi:DNA polymerase III subunit delta'
MTVWDSLVGQSAVVDWLTDAALDAADEPAGPAMTHAWLVTGPPGSGRSTAATAFAAALMCTGQTRGCGECEQCRAVLRGAHPDVEIIRPQGVSYKTADARALVTRASIAPSSGRWHVIVIEDADRLTETANNVLLKAIEEPPPRAVWLLCTPSVEDVLPTIRSRCRHVMLRTPSPDEVANYLIESNGIDRGTARFAAHAAQGHVGRAKALARDENARSRRRDILSIPARLLDLKTCMQAAENMVDTAKTDARSITDPIDTQELADLRLAWGQGAEGKGVKSGARGIKGAEKELEDRQKSRRTRTERDQLDRALVDLLGFYRDVLAIQLGAVDQQISLINEEMVDEVARVAAESNAIETMWRVDAVERARLALIANVTPRLAMESLTIDLRRPSLRRASSA